MSRSFGKQIYYHPSLNTHNARPGDEVEYPVGTEQFINDNRPYDMYYERLINLIDNQKVLGRFVIIGIRVVPPRQFNPRIKPEWQGFMLRLKCIN